MPDPIAWIDSQLPRMKESLIEWANHNSHTYNVEGLAWMATQVWERLASLGAKTSLIDLPPAESIDDRGEKVLHPLGRAVHAMKRPDAPVKVLLGIHMDTVFAADDPFQSVREIDANTLNGPGVVDAKGGLVVLLTALEALERSDFAQCIGWEVLINPDEEIGSPSSGTILAECARRNHFGLVYEPAQPDGNLVGERKGSGTFIFVVHGKAAHSGRDFAAGRNAIVAAAELVRELHTMNASFTPGTTFNIGRIIGGGASNIVPDKCVVTVNIRTVIREEERVIAARIDEVVDEINRHDGIRAERFGEFRSPPKPLDARSKQLLDVIIPAGGELGLSLNHKPSGGTCDGNKLAAAGLPVIDSMGPRGGNLHSPDEFVQVDSLVERAKLSFLTMRRLAGQ